MIITLGTGNSHKAEEINAINPFPEIKITAAPSEFNPEETGCDYEENAFIKAKEASLLVGGYAFADDTGLCVDAMGGGPGLYTARYAPTQAEKIAKMLNELKNIPFEERRARFVCHMVLTDKNGDIVFKTFGKIEGFIAEKPSGEHGFGYDPIFFVPEYGKTIAQLDEAIKNKISHRAKALVPMMNYIKNNL